MKREALVPIDDELLAMISAQHDRVRLRWPDVTPVLFPRPQTNLPGTRPVGGSTYRGALYCWLADCDIRDEHGTPVHPAGTRPVRSPVTFAGVAKTAGVSRSWLYTQPDISSQIRRLRQNTSSAGSAGAIPAGQRTTDASLRARLATALDRNKQLADENARLRRQLARALDDQRSARTRSGNDPEE